MGLYWALSTARLTPCGSLWTSAHGPWTYSRAHGGPSPPSLLPDLAHVHRAHAWAVGEGGCSPVFFRGGAPIGGERPVSPRGSAGVRLERGKASSGHGDCVCGVKGAARASQGVGHGDRRLKLHRRAGRRGCCGIGHFCGARGRHSAPASMLGRSRGLLGAPVTLATAADFRAQRWRGAWVSTWLQWGGHGVRVVPAIKTGETRER